MNSEKETTNNNHETLREAWDAKIIFQRHGAYQGGVPADGWLNPSDEEKATLGHLTTEGKEDVQDRASKRVGRILDEAGDKVDFLVIASPTKWLGHDELGQRAIETGEIISDEVRRQLKERGLSEAQLLNTTASFKGDTVRESADLVESRMFEDDSDFVSQLREKYGGQNREFWDAYNADADQERRKQAGAEGSPEAADRANKVINVIARWVKIRHLEYPDRKTVVFIVSHHEVIEPYAQKVLGAKPGEFEPQHNDGLEINISEQEGAGRAEVAGRIAEVALAKHGLPPSVESEQDA